MTLDEFLRWDDGTATHYELIGGSPRAMPPSLVAHPDNPLGYEDRRYAR
jgi:hypothetical protein